MDLKGKVSFIQDGKTTVDIIDFATGELVKQHDVGGTLCIGASIQMNVAAMAIGEPYTGVHVMDQETGVMLHKFILPSGMGAKVALSKDALTLGVGTNTGLMMMMMKLMMLMMMSMMTLMTLMMLMMKTDTFYCCFHSLRLYVHSEANRQRPV